MTNQFVKSKEDELPDNIRKAIDNMVKRMNDKIKYPKDKNDEVKADKTYKVVRSRGKLFDASKSLMDLIGVNNSNDDYLKAQIISGLQNTYNELQEVITDAIPYNVSDDYIASITDAIELAAKLSKNILLQISLLEDKDAINKQIVESKNTGTIAEHYTIRGFD